MWIDESSLISFGIAGETNAKATAAANKNTVATKEKLNVRQYFASKITH